MASPIIIAKSGSFEEFMGTYEPATATHLYGGQTLLFSSVVNRDIEARVAITMRLLDDGADPSVVCSGLNVLHGLFGYRGHDGESEAPMVQRLIGGGADVNLVSKKFGPPLVGLMMNGPLPESARLPFYEVFFATPDLDLNVPSTRGGGKSLREYIMATPGMPLLQDQVLAFEGNRSATH